MHYRQHAVIEEKHSRVSKHSALKHSPFLLGLEAARGSEGVHTCAQAGAAGCREQLQLSQGKTPSTAPLPPLVSMWSKHTDRSEKSHRIFLLYPKEAKGLQTVHLYSPVLIQLSDLVRTAQFLIAVQNLEGSAEMQPHCVFVITCEQTPGFSYVLLLQWITHQMVQIKKSSYDEQLMNSPHHFKVLLFTSSTAPCMYFLSLTLFAYHQIQRLLLGQPHLPVGCKPLCKNTWHSHCFLLLHKEILWEVSARLSIWSKKGNFRSLVEQMWFFFSVFI